MAGQEKTEVIELAYPANGGSNYERTASDEVLSKPGTTQDAADMNRLGRSQQLHRNFRSLSILGLTCVVMGTWLGMITASTFSLINGGPGGTIWVYVATWFCSMAVVASMAEMASMAPSSGGETDCLDDLCVFSC